MTQLGVPASLHAGLVRTKGFATEYLPHDQLVRLATREASLSINQPEDIDTSITFQPVKTIQVEVSCPAPRSCPDSPGIDLRSEVYDKYVISKTVKLRSQGWFHA